MNVIILTLSDPDAASHGGTIRVRAIRSVLTTMGHDVTVMYPSRAMGEALRQAGSTGGTWRRRIQGVLSRAKRALLPMPTSLGAHDAELVGRIEDHAPDLIVVVAASQFRMARRSGARLWMDFMDVWSQFCEREAHQRKGLFRATAIAQAALLRQQERTIITRASIVTAAGWADVETLTARGAKANWLPTSIAGGAAAQPLPKPPARVAGFIGNFDYWPNRVAYERLASDWLPILVASGWTVIVAGRHSSEMPLVDNIEILGEVADVADFYGRCNITVAPISLGGGIKVKVVESLRHGVPVLGTPESFEGMSPKSRAATISVHDTPTREDLERAAATRIDVESLRPYTPEYFERVIRASIAGSPTLIDPDQVVPSSPEGPEE